MRDDALPPRAERKQEQMWLGHHSPASTLATYVHLLADDLPDHEFFGVITDPTSDQRAAEDETGDPGASEPPILTPGASVRSL